MGSRLGSVGAGLFLLGFGAIAWFVYRQSQGSELDPLKHPAPLALESGTQAGTAPKEPIVLPPPKIPAWRTALDLRKAKKVASVYPPEPPAPTEPGKAPIAGKGKGKPKSAKKPRPPAPAALVQTLADKERILLTIDPVLQEQTLDLFKEKELPFAGAVLMDLRDNSLLVMAGYSGADPGADPIDIITTPWSPAASTFKTITAATLVEKGAAKPSTRVCYHGGVSGLTDALLVDNKKLDKQCADLTDAVAHSHNVIIAKLALRHLSLKDLQEAAKSFMFNQDIPFEVPITPSPATFPREKKARAKVAAGFWHTDLSPIHGALVASIFARNGLFQPPHFVAERLLADGTKIRPKLPAPERKLSARTAKKVGAMMVHTTTRGTAKRSFRRGRRSLTPGVVVAGKTGALTGKRPPNYNYNWLIGFAPAQKPEVAFAVVLANPPKWRIKAHYAASKLIQNYWARRKEIQSKPPLTLTPNEVEVSKAADDVELVPLKALPPQPQHEGSNADEVPILPGA